MAETDLKIEHPYLNVPVKNGAEMRRVTLENTDGIVRYLDIELALSETPDWIASYSVRSLIGESLVLRIDGEKADSGILALFNQSDRPWLPDDLYIEERRPGYHFSPRTGWQNDPNGLVRIGHLWHMFYQHNPVGIQWGNMHWGHAVSSDLIHWNERDDALVPDALGTMFSGSAVIDEANVAGFGGNPPVLLYYTAAGHHALKRLPFTQCLAYSTDGGDTFTKYSGNPIIPALTESNRDPKVIRHPSSESWVMALYLEERDDLHLFTLLRSTDLISWARFQDIELPGTGECPDFFPLYVDDDPRLERWVFMAADGQYVVGNFDGTTFSDISGPYEGIVQGDGGNAAYASQTFSGNLAGRIVQVSWIRGDVHDPRFNMSMSIPMDLSLKTFSDGIRLCARPVPEITESSQLLANYENLSVRDGWEPDLEIGELVDITLSVSDAEDGTLTFGVYGLTVLIDAARKTVSYDGNTVSIDSPGLIEVRVLVDRCSFELFADRGRCRMAFRAFPDYTVPALTLSGDLTVSFLSIHEVK